MLSFLTVALCIAQYDVFRLIRCSFHAHIHTHTHALWFTASNNNSTIIMHTGYFSISRLPFLSKIDTQFGTCHFLMHTKDTHWTTICSNEVKKKTDRQHTQCYWMWRDARESPSQTTMKYESVGFYCLNATLVHTDRVSIQTHFSVILFCCSLRVFMIMMMWLKCIKMFIVFAAPNGMFRVWGKLRAALFYRFISSEGGLNDHI